MNIPELTRALRQLRLGGIASTIEMRLKQAQAEHLAHLDFLSTLIQDELIRRSDRLLERRRKQAAFRDTNKTLDTFDLDFNKKTDRHLIYELAHGRFIAEHQDALFLGPPGTGKSHLAQAIGHAAIQQGFEQAIAVARAQGALPFELRATLSLVEYSGTERSALPQLEALLHRLPEPTDHEDVLKARRILASMDADRVSPGFHHWSVRR